MEGGGPMDTTTSAAIEQEECVILQITAISLRKRHAIKTAVV